MVSLLVVLLVIAAEYALELAIVSACYGIICWAFGLAFNFNIAVAIAFVLMIALAILKHVVSGK